MSIDVDRLPNEAKKALTQFPEFEISDFNDSGANGYVLIGRHSVLNKDVAIKIYFHKKDELEHEPAIIASLNHENILKVYDARKVADNCSFFLMQAANGGDLYSFLEKYNITIHFAHQLLCQLLSGLTCLHGAPNYLVHRDLKPENILMHNDTLVIADFGSVRRIDRKIGKVHASKHSILFRPAEAFGRDAHYDFSSDLYQAGLIGYLLFGGKLINDLSKYLSVREAKEYEKIRANNGKYEVSVFIDACVENKICSGKLINWNTLPFFLPDTIKRILKRATTKKEGRYKNTSEFLADLAKIYAHIPNWLKKNDGYHLYDWKGLDYIILEEKGTPCIKKRKVGTKEYRKDNSIAGFSYDDIYKNLKLKINLP